MITNKAQGYNFSDDSLNPFPGLRSFGVDESHLFFGREGQSEIVLKYLANNKFAAVTGASGSGKSSLIYCGLIPLLYGGFITGHGSNWRIIATRPGNRPVQNLADGLVESESAKIGTALEKNRKNLVYAMLRRSSYGLIDAVEQMGLEENENLLLIFDQFEELFRFKENRLDTNTVKNETEAYIKLIVNAIKQTQKPIFIVLTMRSDFIGDCSEFQGLTKLINKSNFLIPQMTREDYKNAVVGPLAVANTQIDQSLLHHIINTIGEKSDQLPILQHAMMRTWEMWKKHSDGNTPISMRDYEAAGNIENALSMHANIAFEELTDGGKYICKKMFQVLTEKNNNNKGIRHPATIRQIAEVSQESISEVIKVVEKFRSRGRSFLGPSEKTPLESHTVIDISHESLMRVWDKLKSWVDQESASVEMYRRLADAATMYQTGKTGLLRPPDLQLAISWKKNQKPNVSWAKRYNPAFEKVMVYLDTSDKRFKQEEEYKIKLQQRTLSRTRRFAFYMGTVAIGVIVMAYFLYLQSRENKQLRMLAENRAKQEEQLKMSAMQLSELESMAKQRALAEKDSVTSFAQIQIFEKQQEAEQVYVTLNEVISETDSLKKTTEHIKSEKQRLEQTTKEAIALRSQFEREKDINYQKRMLTMAQSMSVKALQSNDPNLKGLLAYQAFKFNTKYNGPKNQPDIYTGLYNALTSLKGDKFNTMKGHSGEVSDIAFVDGRNIFYTISDDGEIFRWDLYRNKQGKLIKSNGLVNRCIDVSQNGQLLAVGTNNSKIELYNLQQQYAPPIVLNAHEGLGGVYKVKFLTGKNQLLSTGSDRTIKLWSLLNNTYTVLASSSSKINDFALNPEATKIYGGIANGNIVEWDLNTGDSKTLYSNVEGILNVIIDPQGTMIAAGDRSGNILVIILGNKNRIMKVNAHAGRIDALSFSPDGQQLASSSMDGTIKIWASNNFYQQPIIIKEHESWVKSMAFTPNGKSLISTSQVKNSLLFEWPTNVDDMASEICGLVTRNMDENTEWNKYVADDIPYEKTCEDK